MPPARTQERIEFLSNIIITAVEGAIGYWSRCRNYHHTPYPASVEIIEEEDVQKIGKWIKVDIDSIDKALEKFTNPETSRELGVHKVYVSQIASCNATNDEDSVIDAELADMIVQVAVLGKVIYG